MTKSQPILSVVRLKTLTIASLLSGAILCAQVPGAPRQAADKPVSHNGSSQILVPAYVYDRELISLAALALFLKRNVWNWDKGEIADLPPTAFHLFEDGKEQKIQSVTFQHSPYCAKVQDNTGDHCESSDTARAKWRFRDVGRSEEPPADLHFYVIVYAPPPSAEGSCHQIKVKVDRPSSWVYARSEAGSTGL